MASADAHYQRSIRVLATPAAAYAALTCGFSDWWTDTGDDAFRKVGDRVRFGFAPLESYWVFEARALEPESRVVLECVESNQILLDHPEASRREWLGSQIIWTIERDGESTAIEFTHQGLTPALVCYPDCEAGWDLFFTQSLKAFLDGGEGTPFNESMISA